MAVGTPFQYNGRWIVMDDNDEGVEGALYVQCIHATTSSFQSALLRLADTDDNTVMKLNLTVQNSVTIHFRRPLVLTNGLKLLNDSSNTQIYVYLV